MWWLASRSLARSGHFHEVLAEHELANYRADQDILDFLNGHAALAAAPPAPPALAEGKDADDDSPE